MLRVFLHLRCHQGSKVALLRHIHTSCANLAAHGVVLCNHTHARLKNNPLVVGCLSSGLLLCCQPTPMVHQRPMQGAGAFPAASPQTQLERVERSFARLSQESYAPELANAFLEQVGEWIATSDRTIYAHWNPLWPRTAYAKGGNAWHSGARGAAPWLATVCENTSKATFLCSALLLEQAPPARTPAAAVAAVLHSLVSSGNYVGLEILLRKLKKVPWDHVYPYVRWRVKAIPCPGIYLDDGYSLLTLACLEALGVAPLWRAKRQDRVKHHQRLAVLCALGQHLAMEKPGLLTQEEVRLVVQHWFRQPTGQPLQHGALAVLPREVAGLLTQYTVTATLPPARSDLRWLTQAIRYESSGIRPQLVEALEAYAQELDEKLVKQHAGQKILLWGEDALWAWSQWRRTDKHFYAKSCFGALGLSLLALFLASHSCAPATTRCVAQAAWIVVFAGLVYWCASGTNQTMHSSGGRAYWRERGVLPY